MFRKKEDKKKEAAAAEEGHREEGGAVDPQLHERVVDTLAEVLRTYGEFAFDTAETESAAAKESFETWARHLLLGVPPPGSATLPDGVRDWSGVLRFLTEYRRGESEYVVQSLADLRQALWVFIRGIGRAVPDDQVRDAAVGEELERLRSCLESSDTEEIRRAVIASTGAIESVLAERKEDSRRQIEELSAQVDKFSSELVEARQLLERDALTQLYNRGAFDEVLERMVHLARLSASRPTLFLVDVDDFKWVNDHFGHPAGDAVLKEVAGCLADCFGRRGDFVARYGGDEFAVIVQTEADAVDTDLGQNAVLRMRNVEIPHENEQVRVTLSIGCARCTPGEDGASWLSRADRALYHAKESGRDCFASFSDVAGDPA